ncbi:MAG TPA: UDP-glucose 4-epimerase GalE [Hyphomicrobiales bacterium]|nr:UDP-glucose 4-epimerase GalE [Hyphomicrobiales bacterium]
MARTLVVVGGAGYIGSHMAKSLKRDGHRVIVVDNFSTGFASAVSAHEVEQVDIGDAAQIAGVFTRHKVDAVLHFASFIQVGESVSLPGKYYHNNVAATVTLLQAMVQAKVKHFIFSSTAAVYGDPTYVPIDEAHPKQPINPYGQSKWMVEQILRDFDQAHALRSVALRYFNAAGADPDGELGERHEPETHLIPLVLQAASGRREAITVFGRDYDTPDGTCIRDYIHVQDLVSAHTLALDYLFAGGVSTAFNLGNGNGFSVQQVIDAAKRVTGVNFAVLDAPRRAGDPPRLVADATQARQVLGWQPRYANLDTILTHAWDWERRHPWS